MQMVQLSIKVSRSIPKKGACPTTAYAVVGTGLSACIFFAAVKRRHKKDTAAIPCAEDRQRFDDEVMLYG